MKEGETNCCPRFDPKTYDDKTVVWNKKMFVKRKVISFFHIPLNFGSVIKKVCREIEQANAGTKIPIVLSDEKSPFYSNIYISTKKAISKELDVRVSGKFLTKVFEGPYSKVGKWTKEMRIYVEQHGKKVKQMYYYYTTCPKCAKTYGKNYVVLFAEI